MSRLKHPAKVPFEQLARIGVALKCEMPRREGDPPVRHIGILFRRQDGAQTEIRLLHLAWHCDLRDEPPDEGYSWIDLPIPAELSPLIVQLCQLVTRKYMRGKDRLAYALRYDGGRFDPGAGSFLSEGGHGLTCATFVLAMFKSHGIQLLMTERWPVREEDQEWQQLIVAQLRRSRRATPEHIRAVEGEIGCARFRPQEVAAAGMVDTLPLGFEEARDIGERLVEAIHARCRSPLQ